MLEDKRWNWCITGRAWLGLLLAAGLFNSACREGVAPPRVDTSSTPAKQPTLALEADARSIALGDTTHVRVFIVDTLGNRQLTPATLLATDSSRLATDASGNVVGRRDGVATVVATVGKLRDSLSITVSAFYVNIDTVSMFVGGERVVAAKRYFANSEPNRGTPQATWTTSDPAIASIVVDADGAVHMKATRPGHTTLTASFLNARATSEIFVQTDPALRFTSVDAGSQSVCALTVDGAVYCWGMNPELSLGTTRPMDRCERFMYDGGRPPQRLVRNTVQCARVPVQIEASTRFSMLSQGEYHGCALDGGGSAYCWGINSYGQANPGLPRFPGVLPAVIPGLHFKSIAAGNWQTCGISVDGALYCWGDNSAGGLGTGDTLSSPVPRAVIGGKAWSDVAVGFNHVCGLATDATVYCWGRNVSGELGKGIVGPCNRDLDCSTTPLAVQLPEPMASVSAGNSFSCALGRSGTAYCWGSSNYIGRGLLGNPLSPPAPVTTNVRFTQLSSQDSGTCGLTEAGDVYCWSYLPFERNAAITVPMRSITVSTVGVCGVGRDNYVYCLGQLGGPGIANDSNFLGGPSTFVRIAGQP